MTVDADYEQRHCMQLMASWRRQRDKERQETERLITLIVAKGVYRGAFNRNEAERSYYVFGTVVAGDEFRVQYAPYPERIPVSELALLQFIPFVTKEKGIVRLRHLAVDAA